MKSLSRNFARLVIRYRITFICLCILFSLFFLYNLKNLSIHTNMNDFTPRNHPYMEVQAKLSSVFGGLNQVSIAIVVKDGDIFRKETLEKVVRITRKLYLMEGINQSRVISLSSRKIKDVRASELGFVTKRLMREAPETKEDMGYLKKAIMRNPMLYGPIVSKDLKATLILADFEPHVPSRIIFQELKKAIDIEKDHNHEIYISGRPILEGWLDHYLPNMFRVLLVTISIIIFLLYLTFRSKRGVILPIVSATMATIWGLGIVALLGYKLNPATILVPFLIMALDICHSVQLIKRYYERLNLTTDGATAAQESLQSLFVPALVSLITDSLGFLTLLFVPIPLIKGMALTAGIGAISSLFTTLTFIPPMLSLLPLPKKSEVEREEKANVIDWILTRISFLSSRTALRWSVVTGLIVFIFLGIAGTSRLVVGDNEPGSSALYPDSPYNIAENMINTKFSGSNPYFILVSGREGREEPLISSAVLKEMDSLEKYLKEKIPEAGYTISLTDYIKGLNMVMEGGNLAHYRIPDNDSTIAEYLFLYSISGFPGDFDPVVSTNYQYANIKMDLKDHRASTIKKVMNTTAEWIKKNHSNPTVDFLYPGGVIGTLAAINQIISDSLPNSIIQISLATFFCVVVSYYSFLSGFLLLLPLAFGVLVTFGVMGLLGIPLTLETLPIASLGIGLGVDYGLYVVSRLRDEIVNGENHHVDEAILKSLVTSGKAVFFSVSIVAIGVFAWAFSDIRLQAKLGLALGSLIVLNGLGALIILPVFVRMIKPAFIFKPTTINGGYDGKKAK